MKRVQVILEEWQHSWLVSEAAKESSSISALLRQLLTEAIEHRQLDSMASDPLWEIVGMAEGPDDGISSENLDDYLYNVNWRNSPVRLVAENSPVYETDHN